MVRSSNAMQGEKMLYSGILFFYIEEQKTLCSKIIDQLPTPAIYRSDSFYELYRHSSLGKFEIDKSFFLREDIQVDRVVFSIFKMSLAFLGSFSKKRAKKKNNNARIIRGSESIKERDMRGTCLFRRENIIFVQ